MTTTARIFQVNKARRAAFAFAAMPVSEDQEQRWYAALQKACSGKVCRAGPAAELIEFTAFTAEKLEAMAIDSGRTGIEFGFQVKDAAVWKGLSSGSIDTCMVTVDADGVGIEFEQSEEFSKIDRFQEETIMAETTDGQTVFTLSKNDPNHALVAKCVAAVQAGDLGNLKQESFQAALDAVSKGYARESGLDLAEAAAQVLTTTLGELLYTGYVSAPVGTLEQPVAKAVEEPACCEAINKAAAAIRKDGETKEQAVSRALAENPSLYNDYLASQV